MVSPTRFPSGISTARSHQALGMFGMPDPSAWHVWFDDFDNYVAADWIVTTTEAGSGAATEAIIDEDGGVLLLTNDDADNDDDFLQWAGNSGSAAETFLFEAGKRLIMKARFKVSDATQSGFFLGLHITDTLPFSAGDVVFFRKFDGGTNLALAVGKDSVITASPTIHTMVDDTYVVVAFHYNGVDGVEAYVNDALVATVAITNLPDDEELSVSFGIQNGEAAAKTMSVDYLMVAKER